MSDTQSAKAPEEVAKKPETAQDYFGYSAEDYEGAQPVAQDAPRDVQAEINKLVKEVTVDDNGKFVYPEGTDPVLKAAVAAEKKYRDTQTGYTKATQTNKELEAEANALREQIANLSKGQLELTPEETAKLDDLKYTDPDAWYAEKQRLEKEQTEKASEQLSELTQEAKQTAKKQTESERRVDVLASFNEGREVPINDDVVANDIPPRITNKLKNGEVTFEEFLSEAGAYLDKGKVASNESDPALPELHKETGGSKATKESKEPELDYSQVVL